MAVRANPALDASLAGNDLRDVLRHLRRFAGLSCGEIFALFREAAAEWSSDNAPRLGAALAYYTLLSIAPLLVVAVAVAAVFFGKTAVEGQLYWELKNLLGGEGAAAVQRLITSADHIGSGAFATFVGMVILVFAASSMVVELEDALNTIWRVPSPVSTGRWGSLTVLLRNRLHSFAIVLGTGFLLLISLVLNTVISLTGTYFGSWLPVSAHILRLGEFVVGFLVTTMLFAAIYKFMPAVRLKWSDVVIGACVTSLLFTMGKQLIGLYLGKESFASTYGAAGSLVALLVWVYYSAQLFFLGAEFTKVYTRRLGSLRAQNSAQ